jgi:hypothetical protein
VEIGRLDESRYDLQELTNCLKEYIKELKEKIRLSEMLVDIIFLRQYLWGGRHREP